MARELAIHNLTIIIHLKKADCTKKVNIRVEMEPINMRDLLNRYDRNLVGNKLAY